MIKSEEVKQRHKISDRNRRRFMRERLRTLRKLANELPFDKYCQAHSKIVRETLRMGVDNSK